MSKNKTKNRPVNKSFVWSAEDRQAFADRNILISHKIPNKRRVASREACRPKYWD